MEKVSSKALMPVILYFLILLAVGVSVTLGGAWPSWAVPNTAHRLPRLVGIWVDADPHPDASRLVLRADHSFQMYKGSAYRKRTATGFISLPRTVSGTWAWEGGYEPVLELTSPGHYGEFFIRASGHLVAVHESGVKGLPYEMRRLLPARRD